MAQIDTTFLPEASEYNPVISPIVQSGNFFIMDSEQLVSKPFRELQLEAVSDASKKSSMTERLTTVKNNICENHYVMAKGRLERQKLSRLKQLHDNTNKLRQEVKLYNLDRQRHHVEVKKRLQPDRDYSYDDTQVINMEKRLGANIASGYLDKKLKYPIRLRSINDIKVTPVIKKARGCLQQHVIQRSIETTLRASPQRSQTARSAVTSLPSALCTRRNSRSAPFTSRPSEQQATPLPNITRQRSLTTSRQQRPQTRVKFSVQTPPGDQPRSRLMTRLNYFHADAASAKSKQVTESSSEEDPEDDPDLPDYIDLHALFHGNVASSRGNNDRVPESPGHLVSNQPPLSARRAAGSPPRLTTDMLQVEMDQINSKIHTFIQTLSEPRRENTNSDDESDYGFPENTVRKIPTLPANTYQNNTRTPVYSKSAFGKPDIASAATDQVLPPAGERPSQLLLPSEATDMSIADRDEVAETAKSPTRTAKYSWECIRGHVLGRAKNEKNSEELILQALTGVPISNSMHSHVPLRTASRALRYTATFKMHKIVERLIQERTRYERLQVEELKKQMVSEETNPVEGDPTVESVAHVGDERKLSFAE